MPLKLMYITNNPQIASIAEETGVDRIFIDMEYIGKEERQAGMDCVKSNHTIADVLSVRKKIQKAELMVRVNPIHKESHDYSSSYEEINRVIDAGADVIMLPMYRSRGEVETFLKIINGRVKTQLLAETPEACDIMDEIAMIPEVDEIHIGLNDLHLAYHKKFMFELLADGTVDAVCWKIKRNNKPFGFGGIARIGHGILPAEYVIREHYRIGSTCAILSRAFCNADKIEDINVIEKMFYTEMIKIRETEESAEKMSKQELQENKEKVQNLVAQIVASM